MQINSLTATVSREDSLPFLPGEVEDQILFNFIKKPIKGGRLSNVQTLARIGSVCKRWWGWVLDQEKGPFRDLKIGADLFADANAHPSSIFLGKLNQRLKEQTALWFNYLDKRGALPLTPPYHINPHIPNQLGETPLDKALLLILEAPENSELLDHLCTAKLSAEALAAAIPKAFSLMPNCVDIPIQRRLGLADDLIAKVKRVSNGEELIELHLKSSVGQILKDVGTNLVVVTWLDNQGCQISIDDVADWMQGYRRRNKNCLKILKRLMDNNGLSVGTPLKDGNHLIHHILHDTCKTPYRNAYLKWILEQKPEELKVPDSKGCYPFALMTTPHSVKLISCCKKFATKELLWEERAHCQEAIIKLLQQQRLNYSFYPEMADVETPIIYLRSVKEILGTQGEFFRWMHGNPKDPTQSNLLFSIARWSPVLIQRIVQAQWISKQALKDCTEKGVYLTDFFYRQQELFKFLHACGNPCHAPLPSHTDQDTYRQMMGEMKKAGMDSFGFHVVDIIMQPKHIDKALTCSMIARFKALLSLGEHSVKDSQGNTLLHRLVQQPKEQFSLYFWQHHSLMYQVACLLIDSGVDLFIRNRDGETAGELAARQGWDSLLELFDN